MNKIIFAADDDDNIRNLIKELFEESGFKVNVFSTSDALYEAFINEPCDLIILDIMMPGTDGLAMCKRIRDTSNIPIIMLGEKESELDYVMGLTLGGDDYIFKPFRPSILVMRIKALFRRMEMEHATVEKPVSFGDIRYSIKDHMALCHNIDIRLTMTELSLLEYMIKNSDRAISRNELLKEIWGINTDVETRVTDETIRRIRNKLKNVGSTTVIKSIWGYGYKLEYTE